MATPKVMIDNERTRVTKSFAYHKHWHIHEFDYVVVPMLDGDLKIINNNGEETISKLLKRCKLF